MKHVVIAAALLVLTAAVCVSSWLVSSKISEELDRGLGEAEALMASGLEEEAYSVLSEVEALWSLRVKTLECFINSGPIEELGREISHAKYALASGSEVSFLLHISTARDMLRELRDREAPSLINLL